MIINVQCSITMLNYQRVAYKRVIALRIKALAPWRTSKADEIGVHSIMDQIKTEQLLTKTNWFLTSLMSSCNRLRDQILIGNCQFLLIDVACKSNNFHSWAGKKGGRARTSMEIHWGKHLGWWTLPRCFRS